MAITTTGQAVNGLVRYQATGSENSDSGAITIDIEAALGTGGDGVSVGGTWPYRHQVAVHTAATSGTFTITVKPRGLTTAKNVTDGVITLSATVADQIPLLFEGFLDEIIVTPAGMSSQAYELSVCGVSN